jgi:hypothetical protein
VRKLADYQKHAEECRTLARTAQGEMREKLLQMAQTWDALAVERERKNNLDTSSE